MAYWPVTMDQEKGEGPECFLKKLFFNTEDGATPSLICKTFTGTLNMSVSFLSGSWLEGFVILLVL